MDRPFVYSGALPQATDILGAAKMGFVGLDWALRGILGPNTVIHNLTCTPTTPASLAVTISAGAIYTLDTTDVVAYGDLGVDNHVNIKQGILNDSITLSIPAPTLSGYTQVFLVEAILADIDAGFATLPYLNAANPSQPFQGPAGTGMSQYTMRTVTCQISIKAGLPVASGAAQAPAPDFGYVGLYAITVATGQAAVLSGNITQLTTAPFFPTLPSIPNAVQTNLWTYAIDTGVVNAMIATVYPPITTLVPGTGCLIKVANGNTSAVTFNLNGTGAQQVHRANGAQLASGDINANELLAMVWDGAAWQVLNYFGFTATTVNNNTFNLQIPYGADTGAINAMASTFSPAVTSYFAGLTVEILAANTNTGATTLSANGLAAQPLTQHGAAVFPRAIVAGQILTLVYDGTSFQIVNTRWPYGSFDVSAPPVSDVNMQVGDQQTITFTNVVQVPLKVASPPGFYRLDIALTANNAHDSEPYLLANNIVYAPSQRFDHWSITLGQFLVNSFPYVNGSPWAQIWDNTFPNYAGAFQCDCFLDAEVGSGINNSVLGAQAMNSGPSMYTLLISTFTAAKQCLFYIGMNYSPVMAYSRWYDTATAWTSLGTFGIADGFQPPGSTSDPASGALTDLAYFPPGLGYASTSARISGVAAVKRLA